MTTQESEGENHVDVREVWPLEAYHFTPWLAENLDSLGKAVDMKLTLRQQEAPGWAGFLDILAEAKDKSKVAIENQLEASDSDHFARLIGYAANHDASILIWVAPQFWEYHLKQVAWLNKVMAGNAEIHAVAVRLVPDGDLRPVGSDENRGGFHAEFASVDKDGPEWAVLKEGDLSETDQRYRDFFQELLGDLRSAEFTDRTTVYAGYSQSFPSEYPGITYNAGFEFNTPCVYLWISAGAYSVRFYDALCGYKEELKDQLNDLRFNVIGQLGGWNRVSLGVTRHGDINAPDEELREIREWMSENLISLRNAIQPRLEAVMNELNSDD